MFHLAKERESTSSPASHLDFAIPPHLYKTSLLMQGLCFTWTISLLCIIPKKASATAGTSGLYHQQREITDLVPGFKILS